jgi:hypothetical protein
VSIFCLNTPDCETFRIHNDTGELKLTRAEAFWLLEVLKHRLVLREGENFFSEPEKESTHE